MGKAPISRRNGGGKMDELELEKIVDQMIAAGVRSALISAVWEAYHAGDITGVLKAISWGWRSVAAFPPT